MRMASHRAAKTIFQIETVNKRPLVVEAVANKDHGGGGQFLSPKHLFQTAAFIVLSRVGVTVRQGHDLVTCLLTTYTQHSKYK
jgi:hypothetical protein